MKKRRDNTKIGITFIFLIIFLATLSVSYSMWTQNLEIEGNVTTMEDFNYLCLEGYWKLDETTPSTTATDSSMNQNDGTVYNAIWTPAQGIGGCLYFDNDEDYVNVPDDDTLDITDEITVLSYNEILSNITIQNMGTIRITDAN